MTRSGISSAYQTFPPAFANNPFAYGFALFGLILVAALSLAQIVRLMRALDPHRDGYASPVTCHRIILICLFSAILMGTFPDVVVLLLWNEVSNAAMQELWALDRVFDGLMLVPFLMAILVGVRSEARITYQLIKRDVAMDVWPTWKQTRDQFAIMGLAFLIAFGVAWGKL